MSPPVIITAAPNGARRLKKDHRQIPLTAREIGLDAARCAEAGAAMVHVHVRDSTGAHLLDGDAYREVTRIIRCEAGARLIIQITTEAVGKYTPPQQMDVVEQVRPEAVSIALRELMPEPGNEAEASAFLNRLSDSGCLVQHILYDPSDVLRFQNLVTTGAIPVRRSSVLFVLGRYTAEQQSDPGDVLPFLAAWTLDLPWSICAFGRRETACLVTAAALGGHARVGFENNLHLPDGRMAPDNAALVQCVVSGISGIGLRPASADEARAIFSDG